MFVFPLEEQQSIKAEAAVAVSWCLSGYSSYITESELEHIWDSTNALRGIEFTACYRRINVISQVMDGSESNSNNTVDHG